MVEKSKFFKDPYLNGMKGCKCGGHKRGSDLSYPGRSVCLPRATVVKRRWDGQAEVSRGHSSSSHPSEGPNV